MKDSEFEDNRVEFTARELMESDIPEPQWIVPGFISPGLTLLAGTAKCGKSWLGLGLATSVSLGLPALGKIEVEKTGVLYLALEDIAVRLQNRLSTILQDKEAPDNLHIFLEWPKFNQGGLQKLDSWLTLHSYVKLVIIDVYAKIKNPTQKRNWYEQDYDDLGELKKLSKKHSIAIILIVHLNKGKDFEDPLNAITGSTGMTGAPDTLSLLRSNRQMTSGKLMIVGRDVQQIELTLRFDSQSTSWVIEGDSEEYKISDQRIAILNLLRDKKQPMKSSEIAKALGKKDNAIRQLLSKLHRDRDVIKPMHGLYAIPNNNNHIDNNNNN
ncbi:MAG TPA: AAA family ATPase [Smithella sp.]|jgi:RecA-family ATPase|nr:AAA family ATPase [Smithella sp.]HOX99040.1 AAA family ATPase [Smithella sp.]